MKHSVQYAALHAQRFCIQSIFYRRGGWLNALPSMAACSSSHTFWGWPTNRPAVEAGVNEQIVFDVKVHCSRTNSMQDAALAGTTTCCTVKVVLGVSGGATVQSTWHEQPGACTAAHVKATSLQLGGKALKLDEDSWASQARGANGRCSAVEAQHDLRMHAEHTWRECAWHG